MSSREQEQFDAERFTTSERVKSHRKPDWYVKALDKSSGESNRVGAAWSNDDGSVSIVLDPFIVLQQRGRDLLVTLFPRDGK